MQPSLPRLSLLLRPFLQPTTLSYNFGETVAISFQPTPWQCYITFASAPIPVSPVVVLHTLTDTAGRPSEFQTTRTVSSPLHTQGNVSSLPMQSTV